LLEKKRGKAYEQESKEIEQDDQNKLLLFIEQKELIYRLRIDPETNTKAVTKFVTNLLEFQMNLAGNDSLIKKHKEGENSAWNLNH